MKAIEIVKALDWGTICGNSSQEDNLFEFLHSRRKDALECFIDGFYSRSKNKRIVSQNLNKRNINSFKKYAKNIFNAGQDGFLRGKYIRWEDIKDFV